MKRLITILLLVLLAIPIYARNVKVLVLWSDHFGNNALLSIDDFLQYGWELTYTAVTDTILPCETDDFPIVVTADVLVSEITDITQFDVLAIMPSEIRSLGVNVYRDIIDDPVALNLVRAAVDSGLIVWASCAGPRVFAAADRLSGVHIIGNAGPNNTFLNEYIAAGAIVIPTEGFGDLTLPVTDGNIITCVNDLCNHFYNSDAIAIALEDRQNFHSSGNRNFPTVSNHISSFKLSDTTWSKTYGGSESEGGNSICQTSDGGFIICGYTFSFGNGNADVYLIKTDEDGTIEWSKTFGGSGWEYGYSVCQTNDKGYVITGYTTSFGEGSRDVYLIKTDSTGNLLWAKTFGGPEIDVGRAVIEIDDGSLIICGYTSSFGSGGYDFYLIKTNPDGVTIWTRTYGSTGPDLAFSVQETNDDGFIICGTTGSSAAIRATPVLSEGNQDIYYLKTDSQGNLIWSENYNGGWHVPFDWGVNIRATNDGGYILIGSSNENYPMDAYIMKMDSNGNSLWDKYIGDPDFFDYGSAVIQTNDGGYMICGMHKYTETLENDVFLIRTNTVGEENWTITFGNPGSDWANAICQTNDGHYFVAGQTTVSGTHTFDVWLTKFFNPLYTQFTADSITGHAPLQVNFVDQSLGGITSWEWDFDNDGIVDSYQKNPTWTFKNPGTYAVTLTIKNDFDTHTTTKEDFINVFDGESALFFTGNQAFAKCTAQSNIALSHAFTFEVWFYLTDVTVTKRIFEKNNVEISVIPRSATIANFVSIRLATEYNTNCFIYTPTNSVSVGQWQHLAVCYDSSTGIKIFINGIAQNLQFIGGQPHGNLTDNSAHDLFIGSNKTGTIRYTGRLDEIRLWNISRGAAEIQHTYDHYLSGNEQGLICYWQSNEGFGVITADKIPNRNLLLLEDVSWRQGIHLQEAVDVRNNALLQIPEQFQLYQNFPNPFNPSTTIKYDLLYKTKVTLKVFDILGKEIITLVNESQDAGSYNVEFDAAHLSAGIYFYRLIAGKNYMTKKMSLIK